MFVMFNKFFDWLFNKSAFQAQLAYPLNCHCEPPLQELYKL